MLTENHARSDTPVDLVVLTSIPFFPRDRCHSRTFSSSFNRDDLAKPG